MNHTKVTDIFLIRIFECFCSKYANDFSFDMILTNLLDKYLYKLIWAQNDTSISYLFLMIKCLPDHPKDMNTKFSEYFFYGIYKYTSFILAVAEKCV